MNHRILSALCCTLLSISCNSVDSGNVRYIGGTPDKISNGVLFEKVEHIPLGYAEDFMLGEVCDVEYWNGRWYVLDNKFRNAICAFDEVGNPLCFYGRVGRGPGEYVKIQSFDISPETGEVCVVCQGNRLVLLDSELNYKDEYMTDSYSYVRAAWFADGLLLFDFSESAIDYLAMGNKTVKRIFSTDKDACNVFNNEAVFMRDGERMFFHTETDDNVYEINSSLKLNPVLTLDYKNRKGIQKYFRNNTIDSLTPDERMDFIRPAVNYIVFNESTYTLGYTYLMHRISICDPESQDIVARTFGSHFTNGMIVGSVSSAFYEPEQFQDIYAGIDVSYASVSKSSMETNPVLIVHHLRDE